MTNDSNLTPEVSWYLTDRGLTFNSTVQRIATEYQQGLAPGEPFDPDAVDRLLQERAW